MSDAAAVVEQPITSDQPSNAPPPPAPSALALGGGTPTTIQEQIPEKFRSFSDEDNKNFNLEASASKLAQAYSALEKKLGAGAELAPESADKYELDGKALGVDDVKAFMADEKNKSFLAKAHAHGLSNKQVQMVIEHALNEFAPDLQIGSTQLKTNECIQQLKASVWKTDAEYNQNMQTAHRFFRSLPEAYQQKVDSRLGNDPLFLEIAALIGKEMTEDTAVNNQESPKKTTIDELMKSDAYLNSAHPQHAQVSEQVRVWYEKKYPNS